MCRWLVNKELEQGTEEDRRVALTSVFSVAVDAADLVLGIHL